MNKKYQRPFIILSFFLAVCGGDVFGQQDPMYSQYMFNMLSINPAYAGSREMVSMTTMYRKQWVGIEGAPTTLTFSADAPIQNQRMALGLNVVNDKIGISSDVMINAVYAYRIRLMNNAVISFGLQAGVNQYKADYSSVNTSTYYSGTVQDNAFAGSMSSFFPNFGFGTYYYTSRFYVGLALPKMIKNNLNGENSPTLDFSSFPNRQNRHLFVTSGYSFDLNENIALKPSVLVKGVKGAPLEMDVNVNAWWKNTVGGGLSYRSADAIVAMVEFKPKPEFHIGYAYDMTISGLSGTNTGSHEVMLRFEPHAAKVKSRARFNNAGARKQKQVQSLKRKNWRKKNRMMRRR